MTTLTTTAYYARRTVMYGAAGLVSLVVLRFAWDLFSRWWLVFHPPPPPPPTVSFGALPEIQFPKGIDRAGFSYRLETVSGAAPNLGSQENVYFMPAFRANVLGLELAKSLAGKLGFLSESTPQDEQIYSWTREGSLPGSLMVNLVTGYFSLDTAWYRDSEMTSARAPSEQEAISAAQNYLRNAGLLTDDLSKGKTRIEFLQAGTGVFTSAISQSEANFTKVHFFRSDINTIPVVTPQEDKALVQVIVSGAKTGERRIAGLTYKYSPIEIDTRATYPLRGTTRAWEDLQNGEGMIAKLTGGVRNVVVREITLSYYDADMPQQFLQPVYVFAGDNGFIGYVSAIDPKWLGKP